MRYRKTDDELRRRLLRWSAVDAGSAVIAGERCRIWGRATRGGYGRLWDGERVRDTHRLSYELFVGLVPAGLDVLHRCDRPGCVEPRHLWCGTQAENNADRDAKGRNGGGWKNAGHCRSSEVRGERHPRSKLTEDEARMLKGLMLGSGRVVISDLAREYGVSASLLYGLRDGRNWGWL